MSRADWTVVVGFEAQEDLWRFPWDRDVEVGGVCMGRFENSGINRRDTGHHVFVRRIIHSDRGGDSTSVDINYDDLIAKQTIPFPSSPGQRGRGRFGADDPGLIIGSLHSHPGIDRQRELSDGDVSTAAANARNAVPALAGRPFLNLLATAGEGWSEGMPEEDWTADGVVLDYFLVNADRPIIRPRVYKQSAVEWLCEERQRELLAHRGD